MPAMRLSAGGCFIFSFFFKRAPTSSSMLRSKISISSISSALAASRWIASSFSCFHSGIGLLIDSSFVVVAVVVVVVAGSFLIRNALLIFYGPRGQQLWKRFSPDLATMDIEEGFFLGGGRERESSRASIEGNIESLTFVRSLERSRQVADRDADLVLVGRHEEGRRDVLRRRRRRRRRRALAHDDVVVDRRLRRRRLAAARLVLVLRTFPKRSSLLVPRQAAHTRNMIRYQRCQPEVRLG